MRGALRVAHLAVLVALTWSVSARSAGSRVVIVRDRDADAAIVRAEVRLAAELRAAGFVVEERVVEGDEARDAVEVPEGAGPFATLLLRRAGRGTATDVWVADHVTHKTVVRRVRAHGNGDAGDRSLALRVVELMRASLVEGLVLPAAEDDSPTPAPANPPPADVAAWTREALRDAPSTKPARLAIAVGAAGLFAGPGIGVAAAPELRVAWHAAPSWTIGVFGVAPAFGGRASGPQGSANVVQELALGEIAFDPPMRGRVSAFVAVGVGAYHIDAKGTATPPFTSMDEDAWAALLGGGAGLRVRLWSGGSLAVDLRELVALPRPVVVFGSTQVATAMRPGTLGGLSLAVDL